jgi:hypothetical protein
MNETWMRAISCIGMWGEYSQMFLWVVMPVTTAVFALPLFLAPLTWSRWFQWRQPGDQDGRNLAGYFGRCLGAFVLIVEALMLRAALTGIGLVFTFQVLIMVSFMMVLVHVRGAMEGKQPFIETLEIGMYGGLGLLAVLFFPA